MDEGLGDSIDLAATRAASPMPIAASERNAKPPHDAVSEVSAEEVYALVAGVPA